MSQARDFADSFSAVSTGRRNLIINGAMNVAQRSTSETGLGSGDGYKTIDRYQAQFNTAARFTFSQETSDVPDGFSSAFKIATTTADTTVAAGEYVVIQQPIEAQNLQHLKVGSSDAESLTFSFYAKANASATYMVELQTLDGTVKNAQHQFTVTDSWQRFSVTFKGNTAGTINNDTGPGLEVKFWLHAGSDFTSGTYTAGEFSSNTSADRAVGIDSIADSTSRTLLFTGWQLEVGNSASPFEHRSYGEELALCQRYFFAEPHTDTYHNVCNGFHPSTTLFIGNKDLPVPMRAGPSVSSSGSYECAGTASLDASNIIIVDSSGANVSNIQIRATVSGATTGNGTVLRNKNDATATFHLDAEL